MSIRRQLRHGVRVPIAATELRYAARRLRNSPGLTVVSVVTLALGIGTTTAIFSAIDPILVRPLPYPHADRLATIWDVASYDSRAMQTFAGYRELAARTRAFSDLAAMKPWQPTITGRGEADRIDGQRVSAGYFHTLGVAPALGRDFDSADDRVGGPNVAVLGDALWHRHFDGDPAIVGRPILLNGVPYMVAGVMPSGFEDVLAPSAEIWGLLQYDAALPADGREWGHHLRLIGRMRPGVGIAAARNDLNDIARTPRSDFPRQPHASMRQGLIADPLQADLVRSIKPILLLVVGAVLLLLVTACMNVANLLLARGARRRGELAMRAALGAGRARLIGETIAESFWLAALGGAGALAIAYGGASALVALSPPTLPRLSAIAVDIRAFGFAFGVSAIVGIAVGLIPALQTRSLDLSAALQDHSRVAGTHQRMRRTLVIVEVAFALVLLVGAGLLLRSLDRLFAVHPGFDPARVLTMQVQVASATPYSDENGSRRFFAAALERVRAVPGVEAAALTGQLPLSGDSSVPEIFAVSFEPRGGDAPERANALRYAVTPGYFETLGIPLRRGRLFDGGDTVPAGVRPVIVSESFARRAFGSRDPIGRRLRFGGPSDRPWDVIVGVAGDVKQSSLGEAQLNAVYVTTAQWLWADNPLWLVVRARGDAAALATAVKNAVWSVDRNQPIVRAATLARVLERSEAPRRFALTIFAVFGLTALVLAAIGLYGVLSGSVAERTREIGVRSALGASRGDILGLVAREGLTLTAAGAGLGLAGAASASGALGALLFGISPLDPATYAASAALVGAVAAIACAVPAWRAAAVDPAITLRG